jgi:gliding motility-associated-like protein
MKKIFALFIAIIGFSIIAFSQTYTMSNSTVTTCSGTFYDPGGTGNYANNQNVTMTFCSGNGQSVLLQFSQFALENNWDYLYIYNGPSTASPLIGTYTGTNNPGTVVGTSGCITVRFTSDGSITAAGFTAAINCSTPPPPPTGTTVNFTCTAGSQNWVVPPCVTSINVVVEGAQGGGGANGGLGAVVTTSLAVIPGQTLIVSVGCVGFCPTGTTFGGGGNGQTANTLSNASCDGGGASSISLGASSLVVAAGGGGMGGGTQNGAGGIGGCLTGSIGGTSFGNGATGGTQTAGGIGGSPWIPSGNTGQNGSFGQGGYGATDPCFNQGPGGGGGGGYYGGAGGGSDCFDFGSLAGGGGGGGGGSSFIPAGGGCSAGFNSGPGVVSINYTIGTVTMIPEPNLTVCSGNTVPINTFVSTPTGATFTWTNSNTAIGLAASGTTSVPAFAATNSTLGPITATISITPTLAGCVGAPITYTITVNPIPTVTVTNATVCNGTSATLTATGLATGGTYLWSSGATTASITATPTNTTAYTVVYTLAGCASLVGTGTITVNPIPIVGLIDTAICAGESIFVNGTEFNATTIGATEVFIVGSQGCDSTVTINLIVNPLPNLSAVANPDTILIGDTAQLIANGTGSFEWNNGQSGATIGVNPEETMSFSVMLVDLNGCVSENAVTVYVLGASEDLISIPSGFSPNGDGINDIFRVIVNGSFDDVELAIYNRWGELLHKKNGLATHGWDGTYKSKGQPLGTYAYKVVVKTRTGEEFNLIGNVTLIR